MRLEEAETRLQSSVTKALGYLELIQIAQDSGGDTSKLRKAALEELQRFSDSDDAIDAMYDADMREQRQLERMGLLDDSET